MIETMTNNYSPISSYTLSMGNSTSPESINQIIQERSSPNFINNDNLSTSSLNNFDYSVQQTFSPRNSEYSSLSTNLTPNSSDQNYIPISENYKKSKLEKNVDRWKGRNEANKQKYKNSLFFDLIENRKNVGNVTKSIIEDKIKRQEEDNASNVIHEKVNSCVIENKNLNKQCHIPNQYNRQIPHTNSDFYINMNNITNEQQNYQISNSYIDFQKYAEHNYKAMLNFRQQVYQNHINGVPILNLPPISMNNNPNQSNHSSISSKNQCFENDKQSYNPPNNMFRNNESKMPTEGTLHRQFDLSPQNNYNMMNSGNSQQLKNYNNIYMNYQPNQNIFHPQNMINPNTIVPRFQPYVNVEQNGPPMNYLNNRNNY